MIKKVVIVIFTTFLFGCTKKFDVADLYVDKLVYLKKDSTLFTGTLEISDDASSYLVSFCKGIPCGEYIERETNGGTCVSKGKYLVTEDVLSPNTRKELSKDIVIIDYWQEGELQTIKYPPFFTIIILKEDKFFQSDIKQFDGYFYWLASIILNDTRKLKYDYLKISFVNAVYDWSKEYSKEYKREGGKLRETEKE